ncbi:MAG: hypothetical protein JXB05_18830, partial [Myxococcaceae bacterium]|nr:hypothetical protein [Myxococcaceae bacterium]
MKTAALLLRVLLAVSLTLQAACATAHTGSAEGVAPRAVRMRPLPEGRVRLSFEPVEANPVLEVMSRQEAQAALAALHEAFLAERPEIRVLAPSGLELWRDEGDGEWEQHLREEFLSRFGGTLLPLADSWEQSRLFRALKLSPRYMGEGVREAARELFGSPLFVASVCLSVVVYFAAWLAPEPFFSKAFAVTLTAVLALTVGVLEVVNVALACLRLYRESEAARTEGELEAASRRFGVAIGGTGLRVLVMVASMGVAKVMPTAPPGGLGALLGAPRYAVDGGLAVGAAATAQVVADGSLIISGVATGEVATRLCGGLAVCSTMDGAGDGSGGGAKLSTRYGPAHTQQNPAHNEAIERELAAREAAGHTQLRKNKGQLNAQGEGVPKDLSAGARPRRPDASSLRPDGVRHNTNYVSDSRNLKRELDAHEAMRGADAEAIHGSLAGSVDLAGWTVESTARDGGEALPRPN